MSQILTGVAGQTVFGTVSALLSGPLGIVGRESRYESNFAAKSLPAIPPAELLASLYYAGKLTIDEVRWLLNELGVYWPNPFDINGNATSMNYRQAGWYWWFQMQRPLPDFSYYLRQYRFTASDVDLTRAKQRLDRQGITNADDQNLILYQTNGIPDQHLAMAKLRGIITNEQFNQMLYYAGYTDPALREAYAQVMTNEIPSVSDLIQMGIKDAWDSDVVNTLGYDQDFPEPLQRYLEMQGLFNSKLIIGSDGTEYPPTSWAKLHWRAHWRNVAPGNWFDMFRQNSQRRINQMPAPLNQINVTTLEDIRRGLKIADYPPAIRDQIAALAFRPLPVRYISRLGQNHQITVQTAEQMYGELGFLPQDAHTFALADRQNEAVAYRRSNRARLRTCILAKFETGILSAQDAQAALQDTGLPPHTSEEAVTTAACVRAVKGVRQVIASIRSKYLRGFIDAIQAKEQLALVQVTPDMQDDYLTLWTAQNTPARKEFTTQKIVSYAELGIIPVKQALIRLQNLGWNNADLLLLAARINMGIAQAQSRAEKALERAQSQQAAALQRAANHAKALHRQAVAALRRAEPLGILKKGLQAGQISVPTFETRLLAQEYSPEAIAVLVKNYAPKPNGKPGAG